MSMRALLLLTLLLPAAVPAQAPNPLMPQIHPLQPGEKPPADKPAAKPEPAPAPKTAPQPAADPDALPAVAVRASAVEITTKDNATNVFFDLGWSVEAAEPVAQVDGDLILSDEDGHVHGRVPWTLKDPNGLPARFDERGVGIDTSKSDTAQAWFKGAQPSWIRFGFVARRVTYLSGRTVECKDCK